MDPTQLLASVRGRMKQAARWQRAVVYVVGTLVLWAIAAAVLPRGAPLGELLLGACLGTVTALLAMGLILVYRANRIINFAYGAMGGVAGVLAVNLYTGKHWNYFLAMFAGLLAGVALGYLTERLIIRRFQNSSRLVLTVATIGLAQLFGGIQLLIPKWLHTGSAIVGAFSTPLNVKLSISPVVFNGSHLLIIIAVPAVIVTLTWFLLKTDAGIAVRASAENADRALLLGIPIRTLASIVWMVAGGLAALTVILKAPITGLAEVTSGPVVLLPALAAAVIARMESLPRAAVAGIALGIMESLTRFSTDAQSTVNVVFLAVILVSLLLQRDQLSRAEEVGSGGVSLAGVLRPIPSQLRKLPEVRIARAVLIGAGVFAAVVIPLQSSGSRNLSYSIGLVYAMAAVSLVVLTGWGGNISLGQYAFVGVGAMVTGNLVSRVHLDLFVCLLLSAAAGAAVALLLGLPALRIKGQFLAVTTLAFAVAMDTYFLNPTRFASVVPQNVNRPDLWHRFSLEHDKPMYFLCLGFLGLAILAVQGIRRTRPGRVQLATRDNERAAEAMAVPTTRVKLTAFLLAGVIAGVAGGLHVVLLHGARQSSYPPEQSLAVFSMAVIGGLSSVGGALVGVAAIRIAAQAFPDLQLVITGAFVLFVLLVLPGGLGQGLTRIRDIGLRFVAKRHGIEVPTLTADRRDKSADEDHAENEVAVIAGAMGGDEAEFAEPTADEPVTEEPEFEEVGSR